jgi:hypothetical protein
MQFPRVLIFLSCSLSHVQNILITPFSYTLYPFVSLKVEIHIYPKKAIQSYVIHVCAITDNYIRQC